MKGFIFSGMIISLGLFIGRISGFFREFVIVNQFGANQDSDLIIILLTTPDLLVSLLMGGAMSLALIPEFKSLAPEQARLLYRQVTSLLFIIGILLCILCFGLKNEILSMMALGMDANVVKSYSNTFFISLLAMPFSLASGASLAYLNSNNNFTVTAFATLIVNVIVIMFLFLASRFDGDKIFIFVAIGIVTASIVRWGSQVWASKTNLIVWFLRPSFNLISLDLLKRYFYSLLTGGIIFSLPVVMRTVASLEGEGTLSLLNYTIKLVELPLAVLITIFSIVLTPYLSEKYSRGDMASFDDTAANVFFWVISISLFSTIPLFIFPNLFTNVIYGWGVLSMEQLASIALYLSIFCFSLPFQGINSILISIFSSLKDTRTPFYCATILGVALYFLVLSVKPSILNLFTSVVTFYFLLSLVLIISLKIKHRISAFKNYRRYFSLLAFIFVIISTFKIYEKTISELNIFLAVIIVCGLLVFFAWLLILLYKKELLNIGN